MRRSGKFEKNRTSRSLVAKTVIHRRLNENEDRISTMPDPILHHILSYVDIKQAVELSILSKRWRYLWTSILNLDFDYQKFQFPCTHPETMYYYYFPCHKHKLPSFINFISKFLSLRADTSITRFRIFSSDQQVDADFVSNCISYAIQHNVEEIDMASFFRPKPFEFPQCFFTSKSLNVLKLKNFLDVMLIPKQFSLPALKTLCLERFQLRDNDDFSFGSEPFSRFPSLETLTLLSCCISDSIISAPKLRNLEILFQSYNPIFSSESRIAICAPRLVSFNFEGQVSLICSMEELPCLVTVQIDLYTIFKEPYTDAVKQRMPINLFNMLRQLRNAKSVTLSTDTLEVLAMDPHVMEMHPSPLCYLEHLKLYRSWRFSAPPPPADVVTYLIQGSSANPLVEDLGKNVLH